MGGELSVFSLLKLNHLEQYLPYRFQIGWFRDKHSDIEYSGACLMADKLNKSINF